GHPDSPVVHSIPTDALRRVLMGIAMGATSVALVLSPWGQQSGAHMNPSFTLAFLSLGRIAPYDAVFYVLGQFAGGVLGVALVFTLIGAVSHPAVNYVSTIPQATILTAWLAEFLISFVLMTVVLHVSNHAALSRYTPFFAGSLVCLYISLESPLSGMSMNPA